MAVIQLPEMRAYWDPRYTQSECTIHLVHMNILLSFNRGRVIVRYSRQEYVMYAELRVSSEAM